MGENFVKDGLWFLLGLTAGMLLFKYLGAAFPWWLVFLPLEIAAALFLITLALFWYLGKDNGNA